MDPIALLFAGTAFFFDSKFGRVPNFLLLFFALFGLLGVGFETVLALTISFLFFLAGLMEATEFKVFSVAMLFVPEPLVFLVAAKTSMLVLYAGWMIFLLWRKGTLLGRMKYVLGGVLSKNLLPAMAYALTVVAVPKNPFSLALIIGAFFVRLFSRKSFALVVVAFLLGAWAFVSEPVSLLSALPASMLVIPFFLLPRLLEVAASDFLEEIHVSSLREGMVLAVDYLEERSGVRVSTDRFWRISKDFGKRGLAGFFQREHGKRIVPQLLDKDAVRKLRQLAREREIPCLTRVYESSRIKLQYLGIIFGMI